MRVSSLFVVVCAASLLSLAAARPEAPYIYHGLPQQQSQRALPLNGHPVPPQIYQALPQQQSFANFQAQPQSQPQSHPQSQPQFQSPPQLSYQQLEPLESLNAFDDSYNMAHRLSGQAHASGYAQAPQETKIHKHIYVHVPPQDFEEEEAVQPRVHHEAGPKQKHYKIVFIKAPTAPAVRAPIVPPAPQSEEKTLIYVLHKKPEQQPDIVIPAPAPTKPSKPEVYFIKYKTRKEEAPVYGPPPAQIEMEPRQNIIEEVPELLPTTTAQSLPELVPEPEPAMPSSVYGPPTASAYVADELPPTTLPAVPAPQYLPPQATPTVSYEEPTPMAPIVVSEPEQQRHLPAANYGPPANRFFLKKK